MRKLSVLALVALFVTGSAFAALTKAPNASFGAGTAFGLPALGPTTTNNDDSCDIGVAPAATLLLPYFSVDLGTAGTGRTTIFSITNVSPYSQIAHVTVWTDWSFPVLDFNIFLTGYDVQAINLYDVIARGTIGSTTGTGIGSTASYNARKDFVTPGVTLNSTTTPNLIGTTTGVNGTNPNTGTQPFAATSADLNGNPNFINTGTSSVSSTCAAGRLPGQLPLQMAADVRTALSTGVATGSTFGCPAADQVGTNHGANVAVGYLTIDVAATCSLRLPTDPTYYTSEILFDNVLIGDYQDVNQATGTVGNYAGGNPLVHIRAVPEGGPAGSPITTNLPFTFYDRYTAGATAAPRTVDRRQPLPSAFAARWISGSAALFDTQYKIWREGFTGGDLSNEPTACGSVVLNSSIPFQEIVRFDEHENAATITQSGGIIVSPQPVTPLQGTPETSLQPITNAIFPAVAGSTDVGGWTYFNLNNGGDALMTAATSAGGLGIGGTYSAQRAGFTLSVATGTCASGIACGSTVAPALAPFARDVSQNWVILQMFAEGRFGVDQDANWLGNGCSAPFPLSANGASTTAQFRIAPAGGVLVCPTGVTTTNTAAANSQCTGTNATP